MNTKKFHRVEKIFSSCRKKKVFIIHVKNYFHHEKNDFSPCIKNSFHNRNYKKKNNITLSPKYMLEK